MKLSRFSQLNSLRNWAFAVGILSSFVYLYLTVSDGLEWTTALTRREIIMLIFGPLSAIGATILAIRRERPAGIWLVVGGLVSAFSMEYNLLFGYIFVVLAVLLFTLPMLLEGSLFLLDAHKHHHA